MGSSQRDDETVRLPGGTSVVVTTHHRARICHNIEHSVWSSFAPLSDKFVAMRALALVVVVSCSGPAAQQPSARANADAELDAPIEQPHPAFKTKMEAVEFCSQHEMVHAGQLALLRRLMGKPPLR